MSLHPILAALRRHKMATLLIVLQIALTLAIVCNALFIVETRVLHLSRPSGTDEAHLIAIRNEWIGQPASRHIDAQMRADLARRQPVPVIRRRRILLRAQERIERLLALRGPFQLHGQMIEHEIGRNRSAIVRSRRPRRAMAGDLHASGDVGRADDGIVRRRVRGADHRQAQAECGCPVQSAQVRGAGRLVRAHA